MPAGANAALFFGSGGVGADLARDFVGFAQVSGRTQ
jgi:hypothetical protein